MCKKLIFCYLWDFSFGFRNAGGIGDSIKVISYEKPDRNRFIVRIFYDVI